MIASSERSERLLVKHSGGIDGYYNMQVLLIFKEFRVLTFLGMGGWIGFIIQKDCSLQKQR